MTAADVAGCVVATGARVREAVGADAGVTTAGAMAAWGCGTGVDLVEEAPRKCQSSRPRMTAEAMQIAQILLIDRVDGSGAGA